MQPAQTTQQRTPPQPSAVASPPKLASPVHIAAHPTGNDVQVDVEPNHVTVHTHNAPSPPRLQPTRPSHSRHPSVIGTHKGQPQTVIEVFPQSKHSATAHSQSVPVTTAPTNVSLAPTHSVRASPPRFVGPPVTPRTTHHTHRFPHTASTTSESIPARPHIHEISHFPGEAVQVDIGPDEGIATGTTRTYRAPVPHRFSDIKPIPISTLSCVPLCASLTPISCSRLSFIPTISTHALNNGTTRAPSTRDAQSGSCAYSTR